MREKKARETDKETDGEKQNEERGDASRRDKEKKVYVQNGIACSSILYI